MITYKQYLKEVTLKLGMHKPKGVDGFMDDLHKTSEPHPFNHHARIINGNTAVHVSGHKDGVHIHDIQSFAQGTGAGTHALKHLTSLADKHGVHLGLHASGYANTKTSQLKKWYKKHDFAASKGEAGYLTRKPK